MLSFHSRMAAAPPSYCFVAFPPCSKDGLVVFGKNSARPRDEVQEVVYFAAAEHDPGSKVEVRVNCSIQTVRNHCYWKKLILPCFFISLWSPCSLHSNLLRRKRQDFFEVWKWNSQYNLFNWGKKSLPSTFSVRQAQLFTSQIPAPRSRLISF